MKILKHIIIIVAIITASSCSDYLEKKPDDALSMETVFNDKTLTEQWFAAVWGSVPDPYMPMVRYIGYDCLGNDMAPSPGYVPYNWPIINQQIGNFSPSNDWPVNYYASLPKRIRTGYIFLQNARALPAQLFPEEEVQLMKSEVKFLIAYYNWLLVEAYGSVPYTNRIYDVEEDTRTEQRPFDEQVARIDNELIEASKALPAKYTDNLKYGRVTSVMALAVRARMLLFAASPLVNGNEDYKDYKNTLGEPIFNSVYDPQKWVRAKNACKELIDASHAAGHALYYEYNKDGSIDPFMSYTNMLFKRAYDGNNEILFARTNVSSQEYDRTCSPRGAGAYGGLGVTQLLVDAFFMENGLPITDPNSGYVEKGFSIAPEVRKTKWIECQGEQAGKEGQVTLKGCFNMYTHREPRFYISVLYNRAWYRKGSPGRETKFLFNEIDGGPTHDAPQNGYLCRKKVHPDYDPKSNNNVTRHGVLYRLGEAYLNYAEALNEADPGNPEIAQYVNLIRTRAGIPNLQTGLSQSEMREAIRRERRVELNCESGINFTDIRRWKLGEQLLNGDATGMNFNGTKLSDDETDPLSYFVRKTYQKRVFLKKNYWQPIPQREMDFNSKLVQTPFW